jgi:hypothetical protein
MSLVVFVVTGFAGRAARFGLILAGVSMIHLG